MSSSTEVVLKLGPGCEVEDVQEGNIYLGKVQGFANFGTFVQLNNSVKGLIHKSNALTQHRERTDILVMVAQVRPNGNIDLREVLLDNYSTRMVNRAVRTTHLSDIGDKIGRRVTVEGELGQVKQTSGPTIFTIIDETGVENAAAFIEAGVRAYPEANTGDIVQISGEVMKRNNQLQIEVSALHRLDGQEAADVRERIEAALEQRAEPADLPFLVESEVLTKLRPEMRKLAKIVRRAVFTQQPIILRHHADADGISAAVAVETAVVTLIREHASDADSDYYLFKRSPSKAPFYEIEDITRDLDFMLKDSVRFGQKFPLIFLMDNGSTEEDMPAYKLARVYDLDLIVADHHHPDAIVDQFLKAHVNPYHVDGDFGITAGMIGTELARMINPSVEERIRHLPAIAGVGDRSDSLELPQYLNLVADEYPLEECKKIALALDYEQFWLRFNDGREIVKDILNLNNNPLRHKKLVDLLVEEAETAIAEQVKTLMPHVERRTLPSGAHLFLADVEMYAHRFTFPPPGKTSGEIHDRLCNEHMGEPVVTLGVGPDFVVLRSRGVMMNIPQMVRELRDEISGGGVNGGGHLVVGSIKFVEGMRDVVIEKLLEKIGTAAVVKT
ncbi:S1 RNA-binding domain-containing protein [Methanocalculus taiwanensis]|uniref:S1 RNA-binding domain-containing protein n=1 Tax=Methanocalculus taiwanensis TaxID=106207 RepID=A0ABD4TJP5_9EURY|nr:OB-fold nucleic acid binding domain-containing protein [Methanocalculus taiwanensis]MCQ1537570.1 S1 RNA-binding domain-containing protein [Methanocalculus taiwanensis]